jgi:uncharacterized RDD family membrane protein YckC
MIPKNITCPYCGDGLELDDQERTLQEITCPSCNGSIKTSPLQLHTLPKHVTCPHCGDELELDDNERTLDEITCPSCNGPVTNSPLHLPVHALVEYGGFWRRLGANIIDALVFVPVIVIFLLLMFTVSFWMVLPLQILSGTFVAGYTTFLHAQYGATLGKMATGLSVRKVTLGPIGWGDAVKRSSVDYVFLFITTIGNIATILAIRKAGALNVPVLEAMQTLEHYQGPLFSAFQTMYNLWFWGEVITLLFNKRKRALHDLLAGTVVVVKDSLPPHILEGEQGSSLETGVENMHA